MTANERPLCEHRKLWTEKQDRIQWDNCRGTEGVILIMVPMELYGTGPLKG